MKLKITTTKNSVSAWFLEFTYFISAISRDYFNSLIELTDNLIIAQCFVFFVAGFESSSGTLTFALYELAKHQDIQDKLVQEIDEALKENHGDITFESLHAMKYLDQVVSGKSAHIY